jgi:hypothetical protein
MTDLYQETLKALPREMIAEHSTSTPAPEQRFRDLLQEGIDPRSAMNRPGPRTAVEVPAAGNSHNVAALNKDFTERHLRKRRKHPEYAERILQKELVDWAHRDARGLPS